LNMAIRLGFVHGTEDMPHTDTMSMAMLAPFFANMPQRALVDAFKPTQLMGPKLPLLPAPSSSSSAMSSSSTALVLASDGNNNNNNNMSLQPFVDNDRQYSHSSSSPSPSSSSSSSSLPVREVPEAPLFTPEHMHRMARTPSTILISTPGNVSNVRVAMRPCVRGANCCASNPHLNELTTKTQAPRNLVYRECLTPDQERIFLQTGISPPTHSPCILCIMVAHVADYTHFHQRDKRPPNTFLLQVFRVEKDVLGGFDGRCCILPEHKKYYGFSDPVPQAMFNMMQRHHDRTTNEWRTTFDLMLYKPPPPAPSMPSMSTFSSASAGQKMDSAALRSDDVYKLAIPQDFQ
jgi:hypothetical protein